MTKSCTRNKISLIDHTWPVYATLKLIVQKNLLSGAHLIISGKNIKKLYELNSFRNWHSNDMLKIKMPRLIQTVDVF